jgi:hypothetical protein
MHNIINLKFRNLWQQKSKIKNKLILCNKADFLFKTLYIYNSIYLGEIYKLFYNNVFNT